MTIQSAGRTRLRRAVAIGALGVVFGDIGTSPIYTFRECGVSDETGRTYSATTAAKIAAAAEQGRLALARPPVATDADLFAGEDRLMPPGEVAQRLSCTRRAGRSAGRSARARDGIRAGRRQNVDGA